LLFHTPIIKGYAFHLFLLALLCLHLFYRGRWKRRTQKKDGERKNERRFLRSFLFRKSVDVFFLRVERRDLSQILGNEFIFPSSSNEREHIIGHEDGRDEEEEATGELQRRFL
jgi:hypothetical protein